MPRRTPLLAPALLALVHGTTACTPAAPAPLAARSPIAAPAPPPPRRAAPPAPAPTAAQTPSALYVEPVAEQLPQWRQLAQGTNPELKCEALAQLAWMRDPDGVALAVAALGDRDEAVQGWAATALGTYGSPMADKATSALRAALETAGPGCRALSAWALVELGDRPALDPILALYRTGVLSKVQRLGGGVALDLDRLARLIGRETLATMADDPTPAVRQLVAYGLSRVADPRDTDALVRLLGDSEFEVSVHAAPGLVRIGSGRSRAALFDVLRRADKSLRKRYLETLRDETGAQGLILALDTVDASDPQHAWYQTKQVFDLLERLNDPRAPEWLLPYMARRPHLHWLRSAAIGMARAGDARAVPWLAKHLRLDPLKTYSDQYDWEMVLKRDDAERVTAARLIADLAELYPERRAEMRRQAEDAVIFWLHGLPEPHANGLRALAALGSTKDIREMRAWANPKVQLPPPGAQPPFPAEWAIAQSALRYTGRLKDQPSCRVCEQMLEKRPQEVDVTLGHLMQGGNAMLGMALRAVGVGAAQCLGEWGDPKGFGPLLRYVQDAKNNELSRQEACSAMAWARTDQDVLTVAKKAEEYRELDAADQFRRTCLLESLGARAAPAAAPTLLGLMTADTSIEARHLVARALGRTSIAPDVATGLFGLLSDDALVNDAALALVLGGTPELAARAVAAYGTRYDRSRVKPQLDELQELYYRSFGYWSTDDLESGWIFRLIRNATAISHVKIDGVPQAWTVALLMRQFDNLEFDNGPHSLTRVVLRYRLWRMARSDRARQEAAIEALLFMKEQGVLLALRDEPGTAGRLAQEAHHRLMNPPIFVGVRNVDAGS
jgi:HEAT repeat protein